MKRSSAWLLTVLAVLAAGAMVTSPFVRSEQRGPSKRVEGNVAVRLIFGLTDQEAQNWEGKASLTKGRIVRAEGYHLLAGDQVEAPSPASSSWRLSTRVYEPTAAQRETKVLRTVNRPGVILFLDAPPEAKLEVTTPRGNFAVAVGELGYGGAKKFLEEAVALERVPVTAEVTADERQADYPALLVRKDGSLWAAWVAYKDRADEILLSRLEGNTWTAPMRVTPQGGNLFRVQMAEDGRGRLWVVWAQMVRDNYDLFARSFDGRSWSAVEQLTSDPNPDIFHRLIADSTGKLWLAWMGFRRGQSDVLVKSFDEQRWSSEIRVSESNANDWEPALAADAQGNVWVAWDTYDKGNYDVMLRRISGGRLAETIPVASSPNFEAHAALACDGQGRVWIAWDEAGKNWGKDSGWFIKGQASTLYSARVFRVACYHDGRLEEPAPKISDAIPPAYRRYSELPQLATDSRGRVWVVFRYRVSRFKPQQQWNWSTWEVGATCYLGDRWLPMIYFPDSSGRNDERAAVVAGKDDQLWIAWATDKRKFEELKPEKHDIHCAPIQLDATPQPLALKPFSPSSPGLSQALAESSHGMQYWTESAPEGAPAADPDEAANVARLRDYRAAIGNRNYRIVRGDLHRHTDISWDGANDGGLLDVYRYAIDAAKLDFLGVTDHSSHSNSPAIDEYAWWRTQKYVDLFHVPGTFVPLYAYERSVGYPNGHRNIITASRGIFHLPISQEENQAKVRTGSVLYPHLRQTGGVSTPHTSASGMGNDWLDYAGDVEPVVEIYSGFWYSSEYQGAPKTRPNMNEPSYRFTPGFVWNAWAKGYKLGVQSSSDHISTHISYACLYLEQFTRAGILQALRERHSYGASDNMLIDVRLRDRGGEHLMGEAFETNTIPQLAIKIVATGKIKRVDVVKDQTFAYTKQGTGSEEKFDFTDNALTPGTHYYYVRVWQENEQIAWSSPVWVTYAPGSMNGKSRK